MSDTEPDSEAGDVLALLQAWINTTSWNESHAFLQAHAEQLLTDAALMALDALLASNRESENAKRERIQAIFQQHHELLEQAIATSIDEAYADRLKPSPLKVVRDALLKAKPGSLQHLVEEHPLLLEEETISSILAWADRREQSGDPALAQTVRFRVQALQRFLRQREHIQKPGRTGPLHTTPIGKTDVQAQQGGIAISQLEGPLTQTYIERVNHYTPPQDSSVSPPQMRWQRPRRLFLSKAFVGRDDERRRLREYLLAGESVVITGQVTSAILHGMAGIGKTYLAREMAGELSAQFPDCVLWIRVGPHVTDEVSAQGPLGELAKRAFGGQIPSGKLQPEQVAEWLEEKAPGRLLVIFDDVWHLGPLRYLNEALPANAVRLITTRSTTIARAFGGKRVQLDRLSLPDGLALLEDRFGQAEEVTSHPLEYHNTLKNIVTLLGSHPLALDIVASRVGPTLAKTILQELQQGIGRGSLDGLKLPEGEEPDVNVERSLALSYNTMKPEQQRLFRALGVFEAETPVTPEAAAAIWGLDDLNAAHMQLHDLADLALMTESEKNDEIYYQHSLLRAYAYALLEQKDELADAQWAHAEYYRGMARRAETAMPNDYPLLDLHIQNILAALAWAVMYEPGLFLYLLDGSEQFLRLRYRFDILEQYLPGALRVATAIGSQRMQANVRKSLGDLKQLLDNLEEARGYFVTALPLYQEVQDRLGEANVRRSLGDLEQRQGNLEKAREHYTATLSLYQGVQSRLGEANVRNSLGDLERLLDNLEEARAHYTAALPLYQEVQDRLGEANVFISLGDMFLAQEKWEEAKEHYEHALALSVARQSRLGQANTLIDLGRARWYLGNHDQGIQDIQQAAALFHALHMSEWAQRAEQYLVQLDVESLFEDFVAVESPQAMLEFVQQHPQLLRDDYLSLIDEFIDIEDNDEAKQDLRMRLEALQQIRQAGEQDVVDSGAGEIVLAEEANEVSEG